MSFYSYAIQLQARAAFEAKQKERNEKEGKQEMKVAPKDQKKDEWGQLAKLQAQGIHILDALAATGLRSVRYLKEIPHVRCVTINDLVSERTFFHLTSCEILRR